MRPKRYTPSFPKLAARGGVLEENALSQYPELSRRFHRIGIRWTFQPGRFEETEQWNCLNFLEGAGNENDVTV
jgi:hypothetical protein